MNEDLAVPPALHEAMQQIGANRSSKDGMQIDGATK